MNLLICILLAFGVQSIGLDSQIAAISKSARGNLGVSATVLETGQSFGFKADLRHPMQSVYKLPISMAVLHGVDTGELMLDQVVEVRKSDFISKAQHSPIRDDHPEGVRLTVRELIRWAVSESDGSASDVLLKLAGGPGAVSRYLRSLSVKDIDIATTEMEMGKDPGTQYRNWSTPAAMVQILRAFFDGRGISPSSRELLLQLMIHSGNDSRIKGRLPANSVVAHKTGSSGTERGITAATNDVGIVTLPDGKHLAIAIFLSDSRAPDADRDDVIAKTARALWDWAEGRIK